MTVSVRVGFVIPVVAGLLLAACTSSAEPKPAAQVLAGEWMAGRDAGNNPGFCFCYHLWLTTQGDSVFGTGNYNGTSPIAVSGSTGGVRVHLTMVVSPGLEPSYLETYEAQLFGPTHLHGYLRIYDTQVDSGTAIFFKVP